MEPANQSQKEYSNSEVTVIWKAHLCQHSGNCVRSLSKVFNPRLRPWINAEAGTGEEVIKAVNLCPSGALSYSKKDKSPEISDF